MLIIAACAMLLIFLQQDLFRVRYIRLVDENVYGAEAIIALSGITPGMGMLFIDQDDVRARMSRDSYVAYGGLKLIWPNTVVLSATRRVAAAAIDSLGRITVIDKDGSILEVRDRLPDTDMPIVTGVELKFAQLSSTISTDDDRQRLGIISALEAIDALSAQGYISEINVADPVNMRIYARSGVEVRIGDMTSMTGKLRWMMGSIDALNAEGATGGILDVSTGKGGYYTQ